MTAWQRNRPRIVLLSYAQMRAVRSAAQPARRHRNRDLERGLNRLDNAMARARRSGAR